MESDKNHSDNISRTGCGEPPTPTSRRANPSSQEFPDTQFMYKGPPPWGCPTTSDGSQCPAFEAQMGFLPSTNFSELPRTGLPRAGENCHEAIAFLPPPPQGFRCDCQSCTQGTTTMSDFSIPSQTQFSYPPPNTFYLPTSQMSRPPIDGRWSQDAYNPLYGLTNHSRPAAMSGPDIYVHNPMGPSGLSHAYYWGDQGMSSYWNGVPTQQGSQSMSSYTYPQVTYSGDVSCYDEMKEELNDERLKDSNGDRWPNVVSPIFKSKAAVDEQGDVKGLPMRLMELAEEDYDWTNTLDQLHHLERFK
ncbi:hypothetical protein L486_03753 [Kwoniella mangroviensis CBS 10435]|uniref:Uncharacterized protein n=1 Tax=Kwoniella mangroviensis CBS 10435 TaxID=1331196 RepID=A0A1B9IUR7_9TREE|nr:hypothetical protein L486_03753 [Kwoniella mangroviensis CBS 10435]